MKFNFKGFTSLLLTIIFLVLGCSGVILFITPRGRTANWTSWSVLRLTKQQWQSLHIDVALLFLIIALFHLFLNWSVFWSYIKKTCTLCLNMKFEILLAVAIIAIVFLGSIYKVPPFSTIETYNSKLKDYWDQQADKQPGGGQGSGPGAGMGYGQGRGFGFGRGRGRGADAETERFGPARGQGQGGQSKGQGRGPVNQDD
jgi:hypothetical protein